MRGCRVSEDLQSRMNGSCRTHLSLTQKKHRYRQTQPQTHTPPEEEECVVPHAPTTNRSHLYFSAICRTTPSPTSQHNHLCLSVSARARAFFHLPHARAHKHRRRHTDTHTHTHRHAKSEDVHARTHTHTHTPARAHTHQHRQTGTRRGTPARAPRLGRRAPGPGCT